MSDVTSAITAPDPLLQAVARHWGFTELRPLQRQAIDAVLEGRDSLLVVPTGGGKSLCYQAPAVVGEGVTVVVSPLISLMKDQVDSLAACGVRAAQLNSSQSSAEQRAIERELFGGELKLLFVSPERMAVGSFRETLRRAGVRSFAIDEAHCISHWGHDFRPEYRQLRQLRTLFPGASIHAYTATATEQVRKDIVEQLGLREPVVLVGDIDRANLTYRILPRRVELQQIEEVLGRHREEAGIIYCIRRKDVDRFARRLVQLGHRAVGYHAGMSQDERREAQEAFSTESCDLVVATVAFGMGIDRSNVRFIVHTGMPKSIEHYQQETGRAGRDGLEAECVLLYSGADAAVWKGILERGAEEGGQEHVTTAFRQIELMDRFSSASLCRHQALVEHFGGIWERGPCGSCDVCLGDLEEVADAATIAKKILSCVVRLKENFGVAHVISVLRGEKLQKLVERNHDALSTFGLLREHHRTELRDWISQLIAQRYLRQEGTTYPLLRLTPLSWPVMRDELPVRLVSPPAPAAKAARRPRALTGDWEGVDRDLFEELRTWRRAAASAKGVPPFVIFGDRTLRELSRIRPSTLELMRGVTGVGAVKLHQYGGELLSMIAGHCHRTGLVHNAGEAPAPAPAPSRSSSAAATARKEEAVEMFANGDSIDEVMAATGRARSTVVEYLCQFIRRDAPGSVASWVGDAIYARVAAVADEVGTGFLRPVKDRCGEDISYDEIRIVLAHLATRI